MTRIELENRKMVIINLTCEEPLQHSIQALVGWSGVDYKVVQRLVEMLNLDVKKNNRGTVHKNIYKYMTVKPFTIKPGF